MFTMPDAAQLVELAAALNLRMSHGEAELYLPLINDGQSGLLAGKTASFKDHISVASIPQVFTSQVGGLHPRR
jgi:hypothetical protein